MPPPFSRATGMVVAFDEDRGLGTIRADDGEELGFHCTAVADGSRTIPVDTRVAFAVVAGRAGRWEADDVAPAGAGADAAPTATPG